MADTDDLRIRDRQACVGLVTPCSSGFYIPPTWVSYNKGKRSVSWPLRKSKHGRKGLSSSLIVRSVITVQEQKDVPLRWTIEMAILHSWWGLNLLGASIHELQLTPRSCFIMRFLFPGLFLVFRHHLF
jgi:hypothetical protein